MPGQDEIDYCDLREQEERLAAGATSVRGAQDAHLAMAERYADRSWSLTERQLDDGWDG